MNAKVTSLLNRIKALPQNASTRNIKRGLRNILQDCREQGASSGGAIGNAERYLYRHE